jgi:hypothetical protein
MSCVKSQKTISDHVFHAMSIVKLLYFDSRLCCEWKCLKSIQLCRIWKRSKLIPDYMYIFHTMSIVKSLHFKFQTMSCWKSLKPDYRLCIPCYVVCETLKNLFPIPDYVFHAISSFLIPGYDVLKISEPQFQTMYSMLCRVWNLFPIPDYVFHAIDIVKSPNFRFQTMSSFRFQAMYSRLCTVTVFVNTLLISNIN